MKSNVKKVIIIATFGLIFALSLISNYIIIDIPSKYRRGIEIRNEITLNLKKAGSYTESFIHIDGNWSYTAGNYSWCSGDGSWSNPYIIENVTIDGSGRTFGIMVNNSQNEYFIIRNCSVYNAGMIGIFENAGIVLKNTKNGIVDGNNCSKNGMAGIILTDDCTNNSIINNDVNDNDIFGIWLDTHSFENNILNNTVLYNDLGIQLESSSDYNSLIGNNISNNQCAGINIDHSDFNTISENIVGNYGMFTQEAGINLLSSHYSIISKNEVVNNKDTGIGLSSGCDNNIISGNTAINNSRHGIGLSGLCNNNNISGNLANNNTQNGIYLNDGCINNTILNNTINNNGIYGVFLEEFCDSNIISRNIINNNTDSGIRIDLNSENNIISENTLSENIWGIDLEASNNNEIYGNTAYKNMNGIYLNWDCYNNTISGNSVSNNNLMGIFLGDSNNNTILRNTATDNGDHGIYLYNSDYNTVLGNIVTDNDDYGIYIYFYSIHNTISENLVYENEVYGIFIHTESNNNLLFDNYVFNNTISNAIDECQNLWDNILIGNYWGNYTGIDADYDGIGDTPYNVSGSGGNKDNRPIMNYNPFFFKSPNDLIYEVGTIAQNITWILLNTLPLALTFNVFRGGTSVKTGELYNYVNEIVINVGHLDVGTYGFNIEVDNGYGGMFTDSVWVTVVNTLPVFTLKANDSSYEVGAIGNNLSWSFSDMSTNNPTYTINRNGLPIIINKPCLSGEIIEISVDGLIAGSYCYVIEIDDGYGGTALDCAWITVIYTSANLLYVEIVEQSLSLGEFNITFSIYNEQNQGVDSATILMWWNENDVSTSIQSIGAGLYFISLNPITVAPGEDPILLEMEISASGYEDKHFETYLAVDPDTLEKDLGKKPTEFPLLILIIAITASSGGIGVVGVILHLLRKRKGLIEPT